MSSAGADKPEVNGSAGTEGDKASPISQNGGCPLPPTDDPELDALLDDALKDFDNPNLLKTAKVKAPSTSAQNADLLLDSVWAEEFIKQCTTQFEQKLRHYLHSSLEGTSSPSSTRTQLEKNMSTIVDAASTAAIQCTNDPEALSSQLNEAIRNAAQKCTTSTATESGGGSGKKKKEEGKASGSELPFGFPADEAEFARMMGSMGLGGMGDLDDPSLDDDGGMNEILPFMNNMMQKLLSKELLQPVLTDIVAKYPDWLTQNREKLTPKDFEKYQGQYTYMKQICTEYAAEKDGDSAEVKRKRFERISDLMLKVQYAGPPPQELIGEDGTNPLPNFGGMGGEECCIM